MSTAILHIEDSDLDAELIAQRLTRAGLAAGLVRARDRAEVIACVTGPQSFDLILSDYQLPDIDGLETLSLALEHRPGVPLIFVSGALGEEVAVTTLKLGATDYVLKHRLERLVPAIERALAEARERAERVRAEAAAREASERLALAQTAGRSGVFDWLIAEDRVFWSPELEDLYGVPRGSFEGTYAGWERRVVAEDAATVGTAVRRCLDERTENLEYEFRAVLPDGTRRWLAAKARFFFGPHGAPVRMVGINIDIHDRKEIEDRLRWQNERLRLLSEAAEALLAADGHPEEMMRALFARVADGLGLSHYFNYAPSADGSALELVSCFGVPAAEMDGIRRLGLGEAVCGTVARTRKPVVAAEIQNSDDPKVQLVRRYGVRAYACTPLLARERFLGTLSFGTNQRDRFSAEDVDVLRTICHYVAMAKERHRLASEAHERAERLKEQDRRKDEFLALLAHELRNPLAPLRNGVQVLRLTDGKGAAAARARDMMERQLGHMVRLIDDLLDISRISQNKLHLQPARVMLADIVESAVETARPLIDAAKHALTVTLPPHPVTLDGDLTRLAQVFSNLLTNSAKYTPPGGRIELSARVRPGELIVAVTDSGIGVPADYLPRIFDMFSQADRAVERATGGLGIGLALVKGLVEMHDGKVEARSDGANTGSTFTVRLPLPDEAPPVTPAADLAQGASEQRRRVLVVDDNRDAAESLGLMLELIGHEIHLAHDGAEGVEVAERVRPDLILMDLGMPRMSGLEAVAQIRTRPWGSAPTIIALTGWGQDSDRERSRVAGCNGHLVKPVTLPDLEVLLGTTHPDRGQ